MALASVCRSCGAGILWVISARSGRFMPLDASPHEDGDIIVRPDDAGGKVFGYVLAKGQRGGYIGDTEGAPIPVRPDEPRYRSHFATCPDAAAHRKPKPAGAP